MPLLLKTEANFHKQIMYLYTCKYCRSDVDTVIGVYFVVFVINYRSKNSFQFGSALDK